MLVMWNKYYYNVTLYVFQLRRIFMVLKVIGQDSDFDNNNKTMVIKTKDKRARAKQQRLSLPCRHPFVSRGHVFLFHEADNAQPRRKNRLNYYVFLRSLNILFRICLSDGPGIRMNWNSRREEAIKLSCCFCSTFVPSYLLSFNQKFLLCRWFCVLVVRSSRRNPTDVSSFMVGSSTTLLCCLFAWSHRIRYNRLATLIRPSTDRN